MSPPSITDQTQQLILDSYQALYRLAYSYVHNEDDAMDIVQECVYKAIKNSPRVRNPEYLKTWLWRILINTALDYIKKNRTEIASPTLQETAVEDHYTDFDTMNALKILTPKEQAVIILRFFEDRKLQEIADILGVNTNTVKSTLYRSLKKLKIQLTEGDILYEG